MLVVRLELHNANTGEVSELGRMVIANDGTGDELANYDVALREDKATNSQVWHKPDRKGRVEGYPRMKRHAWDLVERALAAVGF